MFEEPMTNRELEAERENRLIKDIVAEAVGANEVDYNKPAVEAVKVLRDHFARLRPQHGGYAAFHGKIDTHEALEDRTGAYMGIERTMRDPK